jgi:penicillin-binding protein-related factor A (putative recombinase)
VFRLRDAADLHGINKRAVAAFATPSDYIVVSPNGMFFAEVKSTNNKTSFPFSMFTKGQKAAMARCFMANAGGRYRVYIHNLITDTWYTLTANQYMTLFREGVKSVKWEDLSILRYWIP